MKILKFVSVQLVLCTSKNVAAQLNSFNDAKQKQRHKDSTAG